MNAKVIIKFNDVVIDQLPLKQGDMTIGRRPGCDVLLDNISVSGNHASVFTIGGDSFIQDMNSTNGTFVNSKRVTKHHLTDGDIVSIGKHMLIYVNESTVRPPVSDIDRTRVITPAEQEEAGLHLLREPAARPGGRKAANDDAAPGASSPTAAPTTAASPPQRAALFVLSGANSGKRLELTHGVTNLGRAGKTAGVIHRTVNGGYTLTSGEDPAALRLNNQGVSKPARLLRNGDIIEVLGARMQFSLR